MMLAYLFQGIAYGFAAAVQPGPFQTYLISKTLSNGWRRSLAIAFAPLLSDGPIIVLVLFVLAQLPEGVMQVMRVAGGVFILYLAAGAIRAWRQKDACTTTVQSGKQNLFKAALLNVLNPSAYLFWSLVTGPLLLAGWRESPAHGMALLVGFYGAVIVTLMGIVVLTTVTEKMGPRVRRLMIGVSALGLAGMGCWQIWAGLDGVF